MVHTCNNGARIVTYPAYTKHLHKISTTSANIVQMLYKCFVFAGYVIPLIIFNRKEYRQLAAPERNRLHDAINTMKQSGEWDVFVAIYRDGTAPGAHGGAAFLPWHREYLFR